MKKSLLFALVIGLFAVQANAAMYTLTTSYALTLNDIAYSDWHAAGANSPTINPALYGGYLGGMQGSVGFYGHLEDLGDGDTYADVQWGNSGSPLNLDLSGFTGYELFMANDNQSQWEVALYLVAGGTEYNTTSSYVSILPGSATNVVLDFSSLGISALDLADVDDIGFYIRGNMTGGEGLPTNPDGYHISIVPVPGAILLGILGMGIAGLKLRKFA
ncbi:MAG: hypothetical protein JW837_11925 [Sedimentisphaerales bacterium]|nr:hypothetical protein [Sedimentisphaerales bacterium]